MGLHGPERNRRDGVAAIGPPSSPFRKVCCPHVLLSLISQKAHRGSRRLAFPVPALRFETCCRRYRTPISSAATLTPASQPASQPTTTPGRGGGGGQEPVAVDHDPLLASRSGATLARGARKGRKGAEAGDVPFPSASHHVEWTTLCRAL